jgi:hypothetical protein
MMIDRGGTCWDARPRFVQGQQVKLWLDDERPAPSSEWTRVEAAWQALYILDGQRTEGYRVVSLSLDHDLGPGQTGYDVATCLEEEVALGRLESPAELTCHSANPVGRARIEQVFVSIRRGRR